MLKGLLPRILPPHIVENTKYVVFEGKTDLDKQLARRMRGYLNANACFIVLRDQDAGDCRKIKSSLADECATAKKPALIRIACHELESWYLADLEAVEKGLNCRNIARLQQKARYRDPDHLMTPSQILAQLAPGYQKISGSRAIGLHLNPNNTRSRSFSVFVSGILRMAGEQ